jgi:hypothetical protein
MEHVAKDRTAADGSKRFSRASDRRDALATLCAGIVRGDGG